MRKLAVLASVLLVFALTVLPVLAAGTIVAKPDLPQGYESWPYQYKGTCTVKANKFELAFFVKLYPPTVDSPRIRRVELVEQITISDAAAFTYYAGDPFKTPPDVARGYIRTASGWLYLDNQPELEESLDRMVADKLGMTTSELKAECRSMGEEISKFFTELTEKLSPPENK